MKKLQKVPQKTLKDNQKLPKNEKVTKSSPKLCKSTKSSQKCYLMVSRKVFLSVISSGILVKIFKNFFSSSPTLWTNKLEQGILKGEVSLYH
jgi:hypothetical protein